jgi:OmpA-OmpF porin, OOP family
MSCRHRIIVATCLAFQALPVSIAESQVIDRLRKRVERTAENEVGRKLESATRDAVRCALGDKACADKAQKEGKTAVFVDRDGKTVTDSRGRPITDADAAQRVTDTPGKGVWRNYDFVPGSTVWFALDLTREPIGRFPASQLEFVSGNAQVVDRQGERQLEITSNTVIRIPLRDTLPDDYTIELDFQASAPHRAMYLTVGPNAQRNVTAYPHHYFHFAQATSIAMRGSEVSGMKGLWRINQELVPFKIQVDGDKKQPQDYAIFYAGSERAGQLPTATFPRARSIELQIAATRAEPAYLGNIVVAVHADPLYDALSKTGSFTTRGILFDVDSDRLRPESTPTLTELATTLKDHPSLRVDIEGHTDSVGADAYNQALSGRRATAVVTWLRSQGIVADRLSASGKGESVPVGDNGTESGRQQNRRVVIRRVGS